MRDITDDLRRQIVNGRLTPGRPLPSVRRLATMYGVSPPTMNGALHALAALGFVRVSHGVGTFVAPSRSDSRAAVFAVLEATPLELAAVRAAIDERMPVLAARSVSDAPAGRLPGPIRDLAFFAAERSSSRSGATAETFISADLRFHREIVASVRGLEISSTLYAQIGRRLEPDLIAAAAGLARDRSLDDAHRALADAITRGEMPATARLARAIARREAESVESATRDR